MDQFRGLFGRARRALANLRAERLFKKFTFLFCRYPCLSTQILDKTLHQDGASPEEERELLSVVNENFLGHICYVLVCFLHACSYLATGIYQILKYDYRDPRQNYQLRLSNQMDDPQSGTQRVLFQFQCLVTNCSRFTNYTSPNVDHLGFDVMRIPTVSLCMPHIRYLALPSNFDLAFTGYFISIIFGLAIFGFCVVGQLIQCINPINDDTITFTLAPQWVVKVLKDLMRAILVDYLTSSINYRSNMYRKLLTKEKDIDWQDTARPTSGAFESNKIGLLSDLSHSRREVELLLRTNYRKHRPSDDDKKSQLDEQQGQVHLDDDQDTYWLATEDYLNDCLPIIRSEWWRSRVCSGYAFLLFVAVPILTGIYMAIIEFVLLQLTDRRMEELQMIDSIMKQQHCALWIDDSLSWTQAKTPQSGYIGSQGLFEHLRVVDGIQYVSLANYRLHYSLFGVCQFTFWNVFSCLLIVLVYMGLTLNQMESITWVKELSGQLDFAIEYVHITNQVGLFKGRQRKPASYSIEILCDLQRSQTTSSWLGFISGSMSDGTGPTSCQRINRQIFNQKFSLSLLQNDMACCHQSRADDSQTHIELLDSSIEVMEKLYVKLRLFYELKDRYGASLICQFFYPSLSCYFLSMMILLACRRTDLIEALLIYASCWLLFVDFAILIGSNFNSHANPLINKLWSLTAATCSSDDLRVEHLNQLWFKMAQTISRDGGLGFKVYGFRIDYLLITQISLGSGTLLAFFLVDDP